MSLAGIPMSSILRKCTKKRCGSVVDCSLALFSIFGLFALHQESFLLLLLFYFLLFESFIFCGGRLVKSVSLWKM